MERIVTEERGRRVGRLAHQRTMVNGKREGAGKDPTGKTVAVLRIGHNEVEKRTADGDYRKKRKRTCL